MPNDNIIGMNDLILVTGANGFIGSRVVWTLLFYGFRNIRCLVRPSGNLENLQRIIESYPQAKIDLVKGNLVYREQSEKAVEGAAIIYHLAAGVEKSFPGCVLNSIVTTRNLLDATLKGEALKRFVNISSMGVYSNGNIRRGGVLDESCEMDARVLERHEPYAYAKAKQDELLMEYGRRYNVPYVILRPGAVYGPGKKNITSRVGIDTFGLFLHLGGGNRIPFSYVDNCAEAIVLAGLKKGIEGEVLNIVDDELPTSRSFLRSFKKNAKYFRSLYVPYPVFYLFSYLWERYSRWSEGQLPPTFNRNRCQTYYKGNRYPNQKLKDLLGWKQRVSNQDAMKIYFEYQRSIDA